MAEGSAPHRLRVKVGSHEFEAEGTEESVKAQFDAWKELLAGSISVPESLAPSPEGQEEPDPAANELVRRIFNVDAKRGVVTLRVFPTGQRRDADSLLLLLYGYEVALKLEDVLVGRLKESMAISGRKVERVDRAIAPHEREHHVLKGGSGKGGKYRLTNTGRERAAEIMATLNQ